MLSRSARLRSSADFSATVRGGVRASSASVVVHARTVSETHSDPSASPQVGFVVSKKVGNAVTRNRVKRRLRHLCRRAIIDCPANSQWVVRALPNASIHPDELVADFEKSWHKALTKIVRS